MIIRIFQQLLLLKVMHIDHLQLLIIKSSFESYNVDRHIPLIPIHHQQLNINHTLPSGHNILLQIQKRRILRDRRYREVAHSPLSLRCAIHIDDSTVRSEKLETKTIAFGEYVAYEGRVEGGDLRSGLS